MDIIAELLLSILSLQQAVEEPPLPVAVDVPLHTTQQLCVSVLDAAFKSNAANTQMFTTTWFPNFLRAVLKAPSGAEAVRACCTKRLLMCPPCCWTRLCMRV